MHYVYFIESQIDKSVYVGYTSDLINRLKEHNAGKTRSIKSKRPYTLLYYEAYLTSTQARKREIEIKSSWSKKEQVLKRITIEAPSSSG